MMGELKSGPCPNKREIFFKHVIFNIGQHYVRPVLASSMKCHSSLVRLPAERTNVVNIGASLNRYGLVMSFSSIFLSERNGFNVGFNRRSRCGFSNVSSQK